jgi:hypothetical protein
MVRCLVLAYALSLLQGTAHADEGNGRVGLSPCVILVHEVNKTSGSLVFRQAELNFAFIEKEVSTFVDGKFTQRKVSFPEPANRPKKVTFSLKNTKVYDSTGTLLGEAEILKRVKPGMAMVIARLGDKIGLDYLFVFKKETLIIVLAADQEVPKPEPLPVSILMPVLEAVAEACDNIISRIWTVACLTEQ